MGTAVGVDELLAQKRALIERVARTFIRARGWIEFDDAVQIVSIEAWRILREPSKWHSVDATIVHQGFLRLLDEIRSGRVTGVTRTGWSHGWRTAVSLNIAAGASADPPELLVLLPDEEAGYDAVDTADLVERALAALPERERLVVYLYFFEHMTQSEIGELLGVHETRICQLLKLARERMSQRLAA